MSIELGCDSLPCDCGAEENSDSPWCTCVGEPVDGGCMSCVKTDTVLGNTNSCDLVSHWTCKALY